MAIRPSLIASAFFACAFTLLFFIGLSLTLFSELDIAHTRFGQVLSDTLSTGDQFEFDEIRFGIWKACFSKSSEGGRTCLPETDSSNGYAIEVNNVTIGTGSTRGLVVHFIAELATAIAFYVSEANIRLACSFLAVFLAIAAFGTDIALVVSVKNTFGGLDISSETSTGAALWLTLVSVMFLCAGTAMLLVARRRQGIRLKA